MAPGPDWSKAFPEIGLSMEHNTILASEPGGHSLPKDLGERCSSPKKETHGKKEYLFHPWTYVPIPHLQFLLPLESLREVNLRMRKIGLRKQRRKERLMQSLYSISQLWNIPLQDSCDVSPSVFKPTLFVLFCSVKLKAS